MSSIYRQNQTAAEFDQMISDKLLGLVHHIPPGSTVYINMPMPKNALNRFWIEGSSSYENGGGYAALWNAYKCLPGEIQYFNDKRSPSDDPTKDFGALINKLSQNDIKNIYPIYITDDFQFKGIKKIILSTDGASLKTYTFPSMQGLQKDQTVSFNISKIK